MQIQYGDFWLNNFSDILNVGTDVIGGAGLYRFLMPSSLINAVEREFEKQYDFALIDLPPSFNTLVRAALMEKMDKEYDKLASFIIQKF